MRVLMPRDICGWKTDDTILISTLEVGAAHTIWMDQSTKLMIVFRIAQKVDRDQPFPQCPYSQCFPRVFIKFKESIIECGA